jgi:hypothetical protein
LRKAPGRTIEAKFISLQVSVRKSLSGAAAGSGGQNFARTRIFSTKSTLRKNIYPRAPALPHHAADL